jgi:hypothetical protein
MPVSCQTKDYFFFGAGAAAAGAAPLAGAAAGAAASRRSRTLGASRRRSGSRTFRKLLGRGRNINRSGDFLNHFFLGLGSDRAQRQVIARNGGHTFRQFDVRHVDGLADIHAGHIDGDFIGDKVRRAIEAQGMRHDVERAASLDAGRKLLALEVHRNINGNARPCRA